MPRLSVRETSLVMALLSLGCIALGIGWYLDRASLANDLAKTRSDFLWLMQHPRYVVVPAEVETPLRDDGAVD